MSDAITVLRLQRKASVKRILVLCTGNSCRSQIGEGYLRQYLGNRAEVYSAGVQPHGVNPHAIASMKADGIDISRQTSNHINEYLQIQFDFVITVCDRANEQCPVFPGGAQRLHHDFPDPANARGSVEEIASQFNDVRDQIKVFCKEFVAKNFSEIRQNPNR